MVSYIIKNTSQSELPTGDSATENTALSVLALSLHDLSNTNIIQSTNPANSLFTLTVKNTSHGALPSTGGAGLYIVAGVAIVALLGFGGTAMLKRKVNGGE